MTIPLQLPCLKNTKTKSAKLAKKLESAKSEYDQLAKLERLAECANRANVISGEIEKQIEQAHSKFATHILPLLTNVAESFDSLRAVRELFFDDLGGVYYLSEEPKALLSKLHDSGVDTQAVRTFQIFPVKTSSGKKLDYEFMRTPFDAGQFYGKPREISYPGPYGNFLKGALEIVRQKRADESGKQ